jgi:hypothetical protein
MKNFKNIRNENVNKMKLIDKMKKASPAAKKALEAPSRVEDVRSADKKAETYIKPDGKPGFRMVPVDKTVLKKEDLDEGAISTAKSPEEKRRARELRSKIGQHHTDTAKGQRAQTVGTDWKDTKNKERAKMGLPPIHETALNELTAAELKLINQMYDKKGNLTPLGKKVMDHGKAASKLTPKDAAADKARRKEYNAYQKSKRNEAVDLDELSPNTLSRYAKKADKQADKASDSYSRAAARRSDFAIDTPAMAKNAKKFAKRDAGAALARKKLANQNEAVELEEGAKTHFVYQRGVPKTKQVVHRGTEQSSKDWITKNAKHYAHKGKDFDIYKGKYPNVKPSDALNFKHVAEASKSDMLCKECGDQFGKPTNEECMYDAYDQLGENWVTKEMYEGLDITEISLDMLTKKISNTKGRGQMRKAMKTDKVKTDLAKMRDRLNKDKGTKA